MNEEKKPLITVDQDFKTFSRLKKIRFVLAGVCFIVTAVGVLFHLGFGPETASENFKRPTFLSRNQLWVLNLVLGTLGGALFGYKRIFLGAFCGIISAAAITGSALFYLGWRDTVYQAELLLPLLTGLIGILIFKSVIGKQEIR